MVKLSVYIFLCISLVCLFISNKRQNGLSYSNLFSIQRTVTGKVYGEKNIIKNPPILTKLKRVQYIFRLEKVTVKTQGVPEIHTNKQTKRDYYFIYIYGLL